MQVYAACSSNGSSACTGDNLSDTEVNVGMHKNIIEALEAARNPLQHVYFNAGEGSVHLCYLEEVAPCGADHCVAVHVHKQHCWSLEVPAEGHLLQMLHCCAYT